MGIVRTFLRDHGYTHKSEVKKTAFRAFAAAQMGRLVGDWLTQQTSIDHDIRSGLTALRARSRDLSENNENTKAYLRAVKKNVVGSKGFMLQVKALNYESDGNGSTRPVPDRIANSKIEDAFWKWSQPETATVTGNTSFRKSQEIVAETAARDGESFVRLIRGKSVNEFGFALQLIEPDWIDEKYNAELPNGNIVRMGVELDRWRRPVAYHLGERNESLSLYGPLIPTGPYVRIPASDMLHVFDPERADQTRGYPWMASVMLGMHNLKGYNEAAIINARIGASKMGFLQDADGTEGEYEGEEKDDDGNKVVEVVPGSIEDIGRRTFHSFNPDYPHAQYDAFTKAHLRSISAGLGIAYSTLSNDQREATWSSLRTELAEEREGWKMVQALMIEKFLTPVFSEWLYMALMTGSIDLPIARYAKFNVPRWTGRRWYWVDPLKEVQAQKEAVAAGLNSSTQIIAENGGDIDELYQEIKSERELAKEYGLQFDYGGKKDGDQGAADDVEENPDAEGVLPRPGVGKGNGKDRRPRLLV